MRSAMQSSNAMQPWTPQLMKGPSRGAYAFFRALCVAQLGLLLLTIVQAARLISRGYDPCRKHDSALLAVLCLVFCMDLWLLVRNVCLYLAWTRNRKAKDQAMTTDLEQAHGTPLHATSYGITAHRGAGHHHHTAHLTATPGPTGTASTTTRGLSAMAAVADPATGLTPDNTTQALSDSLRAGLVLESMWYLIFGLSWSFMFGFVWLRNVHSSVLWLVIAVGASHVIMTITTCCNAATLTPPVPRPPGCRYRGSDGTYCYGGDGGGYGGGDGGGGGGCGGDGGGCG